MKAKLIATLPDRYGKFVDYMYEYKGHEYFVRKHFAGNAMGESLYQQHKEEQAKIDSYVSTEAHDPDWIYPNAKSNNQIMDEIYEVMGW